MPIASISGGLNALKVSFDLVKEIRPATKSLEDAELKLHLAELTESLSDTKFKLIEAQEEIVSLRTEIKELHVKKDYRTLLKQVDNVYIPTQGEIEGYGKGPWCTNCFDTKSILIALHHKVASAMATNSGSFASYKWVCPSCKSSVHAEKK